MNLKYGEKNQLKSLVSSWINTIPDSYVHLVCQYMLLSVLCNTLTRKLIKDKLIYRTEETFKREYSLNLAC